MLKYSYCLVLALMCFSSFAEEKCKDTRRLDVFFKEEFAKSFHAINDYQNYLESMGYRKVYCLPLKKNVDELIVLFIKYYTSTELLNEMPRPQFEKAPLPDLMGGVDLQPAFGEVVAYVLTKHYPCSN